MSEFIPIQFVEVEIDRFDEYFAQDPEHMCEILFKILEATANEYAGSDPQVLPVWVIPYGRRYET